MRNGLGISALVLGLIAVALSWIPLVNYVAVVLGVVGLVLGGIALNQVRQGVSNNPVVSAVGLVLCSLAVVLSFVAFDAFVQDVTNSEPEVFETELDIPTFDVNDVSDCPDIDDPDYAEKIADC